MSCHYENRILQDRRWFLLFLLLSILIPAFSLTGLLKPSGEELAVWFQRSGATSVVFAIFAEYRAVNMDKVLNPGGLVSATFEDTKNKYFTQVRIFNYLALIVISVGTIIWGYGDILLRKI